MRGQEQGDWPRQPGLAWQCAELAVHTWDLATALGRPTHDFDPEVAERGPTFMAHTRLGHDEQALDTVLNAERLAPEWIRHQPPVKQVVRDLRARAATPAD